MEGGLNGGDFKGELAGSVTGEVGLLRISHEWEGGGSWVRRTVLPRSARQDAKGRDEGAQIQEDGDSQHCDQAAGEAPWVCCQGFGGHVW